MTINKWLMFFLIMLLSACQFSKNNAYQAPTNGSLGNLFIYTPNTTLKNAAAVAVFIDKMQAGEIAENRPLQLSAVSGWHTLAIHRQSALGAKEELATFDMFVNKDTIYYVRFSKTIDPSISVSVGSSTFGVVDENIGRQMR